MGDTLVDLVYAVKSGYRANAHFVMNRATQAAVRKLRMLLQRLRDQGHCILFSSHVMQEVALLCDEVVVIAHGRVVARGVPEELRIAAGAANFEDAFVALTGDDGDGLS